MFRWGFGVVLAAAPCFGRPMSGTTEAAETALEKPAEGHPRGLFTLFGAEAWERFSYYGMRALLVLYLTKNLKYGRDDALEMYGIYTGLVYLTPLLGGYLADKFLGRRKAVFIGGILMALGQLALTQESLLHLALGLLIAGNGFFKPNISTMVGGLYKEGDTRRDGAFTIFYMGINLGALFSPIVCGFLADRPDRVLPIGFFAAALGMTLGLWQFWHGQKHLGSTGLPPNAAASSTEAEAGPYRSGDLPATVPTLRAKDYIDVLVWSGLTAGLVFGVLLAWKVVGPLWGGLPGAIKLAALFAVLGVVFFQLYRDTTKEQKQEVSVIIILCAFNIFFWMGFEQAGGTMTFFADDQTQRALGPVALVVCAAIVGASAYNFWLSTKDQASGRGLWIALTAMLGVMAGAIVVYAVRSAMTGELVTIPASIFQAINPIIIVALAPTFSNMWQKLDESRFRTSTPTKMAIGMVLLGLGFGVLFVGQRLANSTGTRVSVAWLGTVYLIHTIGELCLSPIGLSMVTKLAPPRVSSLAMGLWLGSSAAANYLAGILEAQLKKIEVPIFGFLIVSSIAPAILLMAMTPLLKKWMHGKA